MTDNEQKRIFKDNLSKLLRQRGKSQREVAEAIGVSPQTFNTWMQGIAIPRMGKVQALADYFGVLKSALIDETKDGESRYPYLLSEDEMHILLGYRSLTDNDKEFIRKSIISVKAMEKLTSKEKL